MPSLQLELSHIVQFIKNDYPVNSVSLLTRFSVFYFNDYPVNSVSLLTRFSVFYFNDYPVNSVRNFYKINLCQIFLCKDVVISMLIMVW